MARFAVILPAAGQSTRFGDPWRKKVFVDLKGRPVFLRTLDAFISRSDVVQTILAIAPDDSAWFRETFAASLAFIDLEIVTGGAERADTVQNALAKVRSDADYVAIHDAARPLISKPGIDAVFAAATVSGAAILATPVTSTVKRVQDGKIVETVDRRSLWSAQTPQVFDRELLRKAYSQREGFQATDEAQLVERIGHPVTVVEGSAFNLKITAQEDLQLASKLLEVLPRDNALGGFDPSPPKKPGLW